MSCTEFFYSFLVNSILLMIVDASGIVLNGLCVLCIGQILWYKRESTVNNKANMFKFLFVKAVCELILFTNDIAYLKIIFCEYIYDNCHLGATPVYSYWTMYFLLDMESILYIVSSLMEVAATLGK
jgi:hypothetical protein